VTAAAHENIATMIRASVQRQRPSFALSRTLANWQSPIWKIVLVLLLAVVGFVSAPADLRPGDYTVSITVMHEGTSYTIPHSFQLGTDEGAATSLTTQVDRFQAVVEGANAIPYQLGQKIVYRLQLLDPAGQVLPIPIHAVSSIIRGPDYEQKVPASEGLDGWVTFSMRIPFKAKVTTALMLAIAILWITELVPLAATAILVPVVAVLAGASDVQTVLQPFANPIIALFMAGFLLADAMRRTGVDRRVALLILNHASHNPIYLMLTLMAMTSFLCLWMSNTASATLMIPIALAVLSKIPEESMPKGYPRALLLAIAYSATIGGVGSALGTPPNMLAMALLNQYSGGNLTFVNWFAYGLPVVLIMLPIIWIYLLFSFQVDPRRISLRIDPAICAGELRQMGSLHNEQKFLLGVFVLIIALWLTEPLHHIPPAISALAGVFVLFFAKLIKQDDLNHINWNALLTFGGGLAIGTLLVDTGVSDWLALQLIGIGMLPTYLVLFLLSVVTVVIGAFISNTACAAMLIPVAIPLAQMLNLDPRLLVTMIAISCSVDFALVTGTPPTMIVYATGLFKVSEIFRRGVVVDLLGALILSFGVVWIWRWLGIVAF
jgi:solute carrier family 13 (sodium-dependent dicarboxylate transporter), member 2/3/5